MMKPRYAKRNPLIVINPEAEVAKAKDIIPWTPVPHFAGCCCAMRPLALARFPHPHITTHVTFETV